MFASMCLARIFLRGDRVEGVTNVVKYDALLLESSLTRKYDTLNFRTYRLYAVHGRGLLLQMSHVAWSVCLSVCWTHG